MAETSHASWDGLVIGGGPAGLMAAAAAAQAGARVLLVEKGDRLGRKLMLSGGGRCNVTNRASVEQMLDNIPGNGRFMQGALHRFGGAEIIRFFEELGVRLKEEDHGRMFPFNDSARTVTEALVRRLQSLGVTFRLNTPIVGLTVEGDKVTGARTVAGEDLPARTVVVTTGGASVPATGSTGDAYPWARALGHTVVPPYPTSVPLQTSDSFIRERRLQGLSLREVRVTLRDPAGKVLSVQERDLLFTHFGLSGPAALRLSHYVVAAQNRFGETPLRLEIELLPGWSGERAAAVFKGEPRRLVGRLLRPLLPDRLVPVVLEIARIDPRTTAANLSRQSLTRLVQTILAFPVTVTGTLPVAKATVTGGGVSVSEIDPRTMASKKVKGLYFAGEVLDVHAHTGGYNITVAFSSGHAAGTAAARAAKEPV